MKKLITIAFSIIGMVMNAQDYGTVYGKRNKLNYLFLSVSADARHLVEGSKQTEYKEELDLITKAGIVSNNVEIGVFYETFHRLNFQAYGVNVGYIIMPLNKTDLYLGLEGSSIIRYSNSSTFSYGLNGAIRQHINKYIIVFINSNYRYRSDIHYKDTPAPFRLSGEIGVILKLDR